MSDQSGQSVAARLSSAYKQLAESASALEAESRKFARPIEQINTVLRKLGLNLITWHKVTGGEDDYDNFWSRDVGYTKVNGLWSLAIRAASGNHNRPDDVDSSVWDFTEAPPSYRIEALPFLPGLLEDLTSNTEKTTAKLRQTTNEAQELAAALVEAAAEAKPKGKK